MANSTTTKPAPKKAANESAKVPSYCQLPKAVHAAISNAATKGFRSFAAQLEMIATHWANSQPK